MKATILAAIAALGLAASPVSATTANTAKATSAATHGKVAQVCGSERAMAKAKKESWKLANQHCDAAKREAKAATAKPKVDQAKKKG